MDSTFSFSRIIASRGYHIYMHTTWEKANVNDKVFVQLETNIESIKIDPYCCAFKIRDESKNYITVGHIPREISRFVYFFIKEENAMVDGYLLSTQYRQSPIPAGGLEVPVKLKFTSRQFDIHNKMIKFIAQYDYDAEVSYGNDESDEVSFSSSDSDENIDQSSSSSDEDEFSSIQRNRKLKRKAVIYDEDQ